MKNRNFRIATAATVALALIVGGASLSAYATSGAATPEAAPSEAALAVTANENIRAVDDAPAQTPAPAPQIGTEAPAAKPTRPAESTAPAAAPTSGTASTTAPEAPAETGAEATVESARAPLAEESVAADAGVVTPLAAPTVVPPGSKAVINVQVGGTRTAGGVVGPQPGVVLRLVTHSGGPSNTLYAPWATCTSDADGNCAILVPSSFTFPRDSNAPWVALQSTPAGVFSITMTRTGTQNTAVTTPYAFRTSSGDFAQGRITKYPPVGSSDSSVALNSTGIFQTSQDNPSLAPKCGLNIGLLVDLSSSLSGSQAALRTATTGFVDALTGTPTRLGIWTFGTTSPAAGSANTNSAMVSLATPQSAAPIRTKANGLTVPSDSGTNWDAGLRAITASSESLDLVLVLTDGAPTYRLSAGGTLNGAGNNTTVADIEAAVFSANALKAKGTTVMALGIGSAFTAANIENLKSISGTREGVDYLKVADYSALNAQLKALAGAQCDGTINVNKSVKTATNPAGSPAAGWTMSVENASRDSVAPASAVTGATGVASFKVNNLPIGTPRPITIAETQQPGYALEQQGGKNAVCTRADTKAAVTVTNVGATGFTVDAIANTSISCQIVNKEVTATVTVTKKWVVNGQNFAHGSQPFGAASYTLNGAAARTDFGTKQTGFTAGQSVTLAEPAPTQVPSGCRLLGVDGVETRVLVVGDNAFQLTNRFECTSTLQLNKVVRGGTAQPTDFTLKATPGGTGTSGVSVAVNPGTVVLSESGGPGEYRPVVAAGTTLVPGAVGSWVCERDSGSGFAGIADGRNGSITVGWGDKLRCTVTNEAATLILSKVVLNGTDTHALPSSWTLSASRLSGPGGVGSVHVSGAAKSAATPFTIAPDSEYRLAEIGLVNGFVRASLICDDGTRTFTPENDTIRVAANTSLHCEFTNAAVPKLTIIKTGWELSEIIPGTGPIGSPVIDTSIPRPTGSQVQWTYRVSNTGALPIENITVLDNKLAANAVTCPAANTRDDGTRFLAAGASMTCWARGSLTP
ncbi:hypothetical protein M2390_001357 [Mycetocola sp. BIGb0189]|uniref:vWA domain-containing protein n=1 Tax=Mycetocola sp. BIGb0189 TaxID=2940604 RepID=UPI0021698274|nr:hypothetical protein [Mycetocola sp. BIGb0189]MCS4276185.1 hypothetical protein [Mycetocola sp. BIGb0189]